jgi:hypothetical protein
MTDLLIVSCSARKRTDPGLLPAIERYDGPVFRVLRKARRQEYWPEGLAVLILSAELGLIEAQQAIPWYERRMTTVRAAELKAPVGRALAGRLSHAGAIFVNMGRVYRAVLPELPPLAVYAEGGIGQRSAQMKAWLRQRAGEKKSGNMTSEEVNRKLKKFDHLNYINEFSFEEKLEYFSLLVEKWKAYLVEKPDHAAVWHKAIMRHEKQVDKYRRIVQAEQRRDSTTL